MSESLNSELTDNDIITDVLVRTTQVAESWTEDNVACTMDASISALQETNTESSSPSVAEKSETSPREESADTPGSNVDVQKQEEINARKERKALSGIAAFLQQMRHSSPVQEKQSTVDEETVKESEKKPMNRREKRALMQRQAADIQQQQGSEGVDVEKEAPPKKIPRIEVQYIFENPGLLFKESDEFSSPLPSFGFAASNYSNNYVKLSKFSPCGQYLATTSQDRKARVFKFDESTTTLSVMSSIPLGDLPYDAVWHPCGDLLATTSRLHPIHLWNVSGGREASYRGINHLDELAAAQTMAFSLDGLKMYAGYNKCIRVFDVKRPGRHEKEIKTWRTEPYREGQKAIVSSISMHPFFDGVYAVGTYGNTIGLYSDRTNFVECMFTGDFSAVTHIKYSADGMKLYSSGRKTGSIQCFDLRNPGKVLFTMKRIFNTQQKTYFDIDHADRYLFFGTSNGEIGAFDLQQEEECREPKTQIKISDSSVPCVSLHPRLAVAAACTGERVFPFPRLAADDEDEATEIDSAYQASESHEILQNTVQLWKF